MSARAGVLRAKLSNSMTGWEGLHPGMIPCYRDKDRHAKWKWGRKKGLRRARRRIGRDIIRQELRNA